MGRLIVTNTKIAKVPYRMKETGHPLYTYEELCYYIKSRIPLWLLETDRKGLTDWVKERGVMLLHTDELSPAEAAEQILRAGNYLNPAEVEQVMEEIAACEKAPGMLREKEKGDLYLSYGKLLKAYFAYEKAVCGIEILEKTEVGEMMEKAETVEEREEGKAAETDEQKIPSERWQASLYNNMALIMCRFFYWEEAEGWLNKAMALQETEETKIALHLVQDMKKKEWKQGKEPLLTIELERKKKEFLEELG